jgi:hypothetical protein
MKRAFVLLLVLAIALPSFSTPPQKDGKEKLSPFVGVWDWETESSCFTVRIGERNDSLQFTMGGVFYRGSRIHNSEWDEEGKALQMIRIKKQKGRIIKTKISEGVSSWIYHKDSANNYNDISFELLNDSTMRFTLNDSRSYWPDTAIMLRRDYTNPDFSDKTYEHMYKGE